MTDVDGSLKESSDTNSVVDAVLRPNGSGDSLHGCSLLHLDRKESVGVLNNTFNALLLSLDTLSHFLLN